MEEFTLTTPALLFSAISLILLAYTNRFLSYAQLVRILKDKYGFDTLWIKGFAGGGLLLGKAFRWFDSTVIDKGIVDGSADLVGDVAVKMRKLQNGRLYSYAFAMIIGLIVLLGWLIRTWM